MTQTAKALYAYFSAFDLPAWVEYTEPDGEKPPYITYELAEPDWRGRASIHARLWYRDTSFDAICAKAEEMRDALGEGISIATDTGAVYLWADDKFAQFMPMEGDPTLKCMYLSLIMQAPTH